MTATGIVLLILTSPHSIFCRFFSESSTVFLTPAKASSNSCAFLPAFARAFQIPTKKAKRICNFHPTLFSPHKNLSKAHNQFPEKTSLIVDQRPSNFAWSLDTFSSQVLR
nr:MAG TPA: hypothetical protein [Bacteriophage sp.]